MAEYFYMIELGEIHGPKLDVLAAQASSDDVEEFAAMVLRYALDLMEAREQAESAYQALRDLRSDMDDDIPF
ncbi:MAG: hypothetical protein NXI27_07065 [Alphaproteobacteria bacterium]|nr:hypothetical protein [Alphaproteobacteria bacterium]